MVPEKLIQYALIVVLIYAAAGQLPKLITYSRVQTLKILKESQSSKWGKVWIPTTQNTRRFKEKQNGTVTK